MQEQLPSTTTARDLGVKIQLTDAICGLKALLIADIAIWFIGRVNFLFSTSLKMTDLLQIYRLSENPL